MSDNFVERNIQAWQKKNQNRAKKRPDTQTVLGLKRLVPMWEAHSPMFQRMSKVKFGTSNQSGRGFCEDDFAFNDWTDYPLEAAENRWFAVEADKRNVHALGRFYTLEDAKLNAETQCLAVMAIMEARGLLPQ